MKNMRIAGWALALTSLVVSSALAAAPAGKGGSGGKPPPVVKVDHKALQAVPIQLGTSGGWGYDIANGFCCGGTLGALVEDANGQYILSNFHVLAADVASGGNGRVAQLGDAVIQPGLIDAGCNAAQAQVVGVLAGWGDPISGVNIDAAIAEVVPGVVDQVGKILEIGPVSSSTASAFVGQHVKKSGRTTGLSKSTVDSLNATVSVSYENECAGTKRGTAVFTGQIFIQNRKSAFLDAGDSGSLLVEDVDVTPRAIGLLFAGSQTIAVANPINEVLSKLEVTMPGGSAAAMGATASAGPVGKAMATQNRYGKALMAAPNAVGHAVGVGNGGAPVIKVFVEKDAESTRRLLPAKLDGFAVVVEETGRFVAY